MEHLSSSKGMELKADPLVYLHEQFKNHNKKSSTPLQNNWVWFSKEDLEAILAMIKKLDNPGLDKVGDGVRLYYGIYNSKVCEYLTQKSKNGPNPRDFTNYNGHNTTFFVPTYKGKENDEHVDCITPENVARIKVNFENDREISLNDAKRKEEYNSDLGTPVNEDVPGGFNVGNICPPPVGDCGKSGSNL